MRCATPERSAGSARWASTGPVLAPILWMALAGFGAVLTVFGGACGAADPVTTVASASDARAHARDLSLAKLPGWRDEGPVPIGRAHRLAPDPDARFHAWRLALHGPADLRVQADDVDAHLRILAWRDDGWHLVPTESTTGPVDHHVGPGDYLVVAQPTRTAATAWTVSAACYGSGCPTP